LDGHKNRVYSAMFHPTQVFQPPGCCLCLLLLASESLHRRVIC
jgi:hypothetical protein